MKVNGTPLNCHIKNIFRHAQVTIDALTGYIERSLVPTIKTLILDNGQGFSCFNQMGEALKTKIYFCVPYKSCQKGAIENANKLIRTQLPRTTNIDMYDQKQIDLVIKNSMIGP